MTTAVSSERLARSVALAPGLLGRLPKAPKKVAVLRASRIGDFICATPASRALRAAFPDGEITMITLPELEGVVERLPYVDNFEEFPGAPGIADQLYDPSSLSAFLDRMRACNFDLALQMHGSGAFSNPLLLRMRAAATAGFIRSEDGPGALDAALPLPESGHEIDRMLALVQFLGAPLQGREPDFTLTATDQRHAEMLLRGAARPLIGLHPVSRDPRRCWPAKRFAAAGRELYKRVGGTLVVFASTEQAQEAGGVARAVGAPCIDLSGRLSLPVLGAVISKLNVLLTNDSGPAHIAYALRTPTVTIVGRGDSERYGPTVEGPFRLLHGESAAKRCGECAPNCLCLRLVTVKDAMEAAGQVMEAAASTGDDVNGSAARRATTSLVWR